MTAADGADARSGQVDVVDAGTGRSMRRIEPFANHDAHQADGGRRTGFS